MAGCILSNSSSFLNSRSVCKVTSVFERISRSLRISNCTARILQISHHHFVLIHGGCHGAWAWWKTVDLLQRADCRATALDLTSAGNDTTDPNSVTSFAQYSKPAVDFIVSLPDDEKVVLVGQSMGGGGFTNLELMESFPEKIALAIFVATPVTPSGVAYGESPAFEMMFKDTLLGEASRHAFANGADKPPTSIFFVNTAPFLYNGCAPEDIERASTLTKPFPVQAITKAVSYTKERHGRVPSVFVRGLRDKTVTPPVQDYVVEHSGPFTEVVEIDAGHFAEWSHADEFAKLVLLLADKYRMDRSNSA